MKWKEEILKKFKQSYAEALNHYLRAVAFLKNETDKHYMIKCYIDIAEYFRKIGQFEDARKYIQDAINLINSDSNVNVKQQIRALNRAAAIENEVGQTEKFKYFINLSLDLALENNDHYAVANAYNELGYMFKNLQQDDTAIALYSAAEKIWFSIGADKDAIHAMNNKAMLCAHQNYPTEQIFSAYKKIIDKVNVKKIDYPLKEIYLYLWIENVE